MKKWIYLPLLLLLLLIPARSSVEAIDSGEWSYTLLDDGSAKITAYYGWDTNITIPSTLDGHPVSVIGEKVFLRIEPDERCDPGRGCCDWG